MIETGNSVYKGGSNTVTSNNVTTAGSMIVSGGKGPLSSKNVNESLNRKSLTEAGYSSVSQKRGVGIVGNNNAKNMTTSNTQQHQPMSTTQAGNSEVQNTGFKS